MQDKSCLSRAACLVHPYEAFSWMMAALWEHPITYICINVSSHATDDDSAAMAVSAPKAGKPLQVNNGVRGLNWAVIPVNVALDVWVWSDTPWFLQSRWASISSLIVSLTDTSLMTSDLAVLQTDCDIDMRTAMEEDCCPILFCKQQTNIV